MAFAPQIRSQIITRGTAASATAVVNLPATVSAGDTLLVVFRCATAGAVGFPGGGVWNELVDTAPDASGDQVAIAWKKAVGDEGGTTITLSNGSGKYAACAWSIRDADDPTLRAPEISAVAVGTSAGEPNANTVTPTGGAKSYLFLTIYTMEGEQTGVTAYPTGYTLGQIWADSGTASTVGTNCTIAGAGKRLTTPAASDDAGVWDVAGTIDDSASYTVAFHPLTLLENVRVTDTVTAEIPSTQIEVLITETLKLDDIGQGATQLVGQIKVQDILFVTLDPLETTPSESIKVSDTVTTALEMSASMSESIKVADGPSTLLDPEQATPSESVKVTDTVTAEIPAEGALSASLSENLKVDDIGQGRTQLIGAIKVQDGPVVAVMGSPGDLSVSIAESIEVTDANDSWAELSKDEYIRVSDVITVALTPLETSQTESIKVQDTLTVDPFGLMVSLTESIKVSDTVSTLLNPEQATPSESVRVSDVLSVKLDPLQATPQESIKVSDQVSVQIALTDVVKTESIEVTDAVSVLLNPEQATPTEAVKVSDVISVTLNPLQATPGESVKVTDGPAAGSFDLVRSITAEAVKVSDTLSVLIDLHPVTISESVKVSDSVQAFLLDQGTLSTSIAESVKVSDSAQAQLDPIEASLTESVRVSETTLVILGAGAFLEEPIRVRDTVSAALSHLEVSLTETIRVADLVDLKPATADYVIHVRPRVTGIHVRSRITTIRVKP